ncbi:MAG TPA: zf-TFIIB domain-containing protein [Myxococcaceae bacterium]|nr:zf-TFIIB domain-containing protein [Myxococcaceae bacterium]
MPNIEKPSNQEDEYFAREEIEKKHRLAMQQAAELAQKSKDELQRLHYMKCPKCGMDLHTLKKGEVEVDTCFNCHGIWLDEGELEGLTSRGPHHGGAVMNAILNIFKRKSFWNPERK